MSSHLEPDTARLDRRAHPRLRHFSAPYDVIGEPSFSDAILDRLVHNAYCIALDGPSQRKTGAVGQPVSASLTRDRPLGSHAPGTASLMVGAEPGARVPPVDTPPRHHRP